jgi:hypothetical protein
LTKKVFITGRYHRLRWGALYRILAIVDQELWVVPGIDYRTDIVSLLLLSNRLLQLWGQELKLESWAEIIRD